MNSPNYIEFRKFMLENNINVRDIANILNITVQAVYKKFRDKTFTVADINKIANMYNISQLIFFDESVNKK